METMTYSHLRANLKSALDRVVDDSVPIAITRPNGREAVLISLDDYESMNETAHLMRYPKTAQDLREAIARPPSEKIAFDSIEDLKRALGL